MPTLDLSKAKPSSKPADAPVVETRALPAKPSLVGLGRDELKAALEAIGIEGRETRMRVAQLWGWIYQRGARTFAEMSNVSKHLRAGAGRRLHARSAEVVVEQVSQDGTRKWLMRIPPSVPGEKWHEIETVYIPTRDRGTLCISSQVGCTLTCSFCHTGTQKLVRNLTAAEIVAQVVVARDRLGDWPGEEPPEGAFVPDDGGRFVSNIVLMGMGEPLYNVDNVTSALKTLLDRTACSSPSAASRCRPRGRAGDRPRRCRDRRVAGHLAARRHRWPARRARAAEPQISDRRTARGLPHLSGCVSNARRITFEYVMLKGVNDSVDDARRLVRLLKGIPAKINLIPFNPWPGSKYECSDWEQIERFSEVVFDAGYSSPVRTPRGRDILAACGQ